MDDRIEYRIRNYIEENLIYPFKSSNTILQDTMIEIIIEKLEALYEYTLLFPEIISPNKSRLDILEVIADQFLFAIREEADIQEQINILDNILYVYSRRGSIDTIENMWKYYGGDLPREVKVVIPSYKIFRYSISKLSGTHVFQDDKENRTGAYEIQLVNNTYPIPELKEFLLRELVAAGSYIYFSNVVNMQIIQDDLNTNPYDYRVRKNYIHHTEMETSISHQGFVWSGNSPLDTKNEDSFWSGRGSIFLELKNLIDLPFIELNTYTSYGNEDFSVQVISNIGDIVYSTRVKKNYISHIESTSYCTPEISVLDIRRDFYNKENELLTSRYPGYFILGETLLGEEVI